MGHRCTLSECNLELEHSLHYLLNNLKIGNLTKNTQSLRTKQSLRSSFTQIEEIIKNSSEESDFMVKMDKNSLSLIHPSRKTQRLWTEYSLLGFQFSRFTPLTGVSIPTQSFRPILGRNDCTIRCLMYYQPIVLELTE